MWRNFSFKNSQHDLQISKILPIVKVFKDGNCITGNFDQKLDLKEDEDDDDGGDGDGDDENVTFSLNQ